MIKNIRQGKELVVVSSNRVGVLSGVAQLLADRGINITAISAQSAGGVALMNFVVDDHLHAKDVLRKKGYVFHENGVLVLELVDKPGVLRGITKKLAAKKIDILNVYGSALSSYSPCVLVLSTSSDQKAMVLLKK